VYLPYILELNGSDTMEMPLKQTLIIVLNFFKRGENDLISAAEPHHFYAAPPPGEKFDAALAAPVLAPAPTLLYNKAKFLKRTKV
jgi:hypothetical protein